VYFVEKAGYPNSCYEPVRDVMSDDCSYGTAAVRALLARYGLADRWCYVDRDGLYHGMSKGRITEVFRAADVFLDMGTHGAWCDEPTRGIRILLDGEPGFTQMRMERRRSLGDRLPDYDYYYTAGANVGTVRSTAPDADRTWRHLWHPVVADLFPVVPAGVDAPMTTVMNWQSHDRIEFNGQTYGQKDVEFERFLDLPAKTTATLEVAVSGKHVPRERLVESGWRLRDAHAVTLSFDGYIDYIQKSRGEFSVCKNVFVATNSGWFSDRSAAYLASGRPVVVQETGFSRHLPCGRGLFAVTDVAEAADAIEEINGNYETHSKAAREIASSHLEARPVLGRFLQEVGI